MLHIGDGTHFLVAAAVVAVAVRHTLFAAVAGVVTVAGWMTAATVGCNSTLHGMHTAFDAAVVVVAAAAAVVVVATGAETVFVV